MQRFKKSTFKREGHYATFYELMIEGAKIPSKTVRLSQQQKRMNIDVLLHK